jgi:hypothetical protein
METSLVKLIRGAALDEGVSLSTWLAEAAAAKARHRALREALQEQAEAHGVIEPAEAQRILAAVRRRSVISRPRKRR